MMAAAFFPLCLKWNSKCIDLHQNSGTDSRWYKSSIWWNTVCALLLIYHLFYRSVVRIWHHYHKKSKFYCSSTLTAIKKGCIYIGICNYFPLLLLACCRQTVSPSLAIRRTFWCISDNVAFYVRKCGVFLTQFSTQCSSLMVGGADDLTDCCYDSAALITC